MRNTTIVIQNKARSNIDVAPVERYFESAGAKCVRFPYDRHLADGDYVQWERLSEQAREAGTEAAAHMVDALVGLR
jgi:hypothetical protein